MDQSEFQDKSPSTLVATIVAAKRAGYRDLEREARWELEERFGIKLSFSRKAQSDVRRGVKEAHDETPS